MNIPAFASLLPTSVPLDLCRLIEQIGFDHYRLETLLHLIAQDTVSRGEYFDWDSIQANDVYFHAFQTLFWQELAENLGDFGLETTRIAFRMMNNYEKSNFMKKVCEEQFGLDIEWIEAMNEPEISEESEESENEAEERYLTFRTVNVLPLDEESF